MTPHDLLKVYLRTDAELRDELMTEVITGYLGTNPTVIKVEVADGRVTLSGEVENRSMIPLTVRAGLDSQQPLASWPSSNSRVPSG